MPSLKLIFSVGLIILAEDRDKSKLFFFYLLLRQVSWFSTFQGHEVKFSENPQKDLEQQWMGKLDTTGLYIDFFFSFQDSYTLFLKSPGKNLFQSKDY